MYVSLQRSQGRGTLNGNQRILVLVSKEDMGMRILNKSGHAYLVGIEEYTKGLVMKTLVVSSTKWRSQYDVIVGDYYTFIRDRLVVKHTLRK